MFIIRNIRFDIPLRFRYQLVYTSRSLRTEAIHVGDEILSINGVSVKDKTLLNCASMLEEAEIVVALQIRKPDPFVKGSMLGLLCTTFSITHMQCY